MAIPFKNTYILYSKWHLIWFINNLFLLWTDRRSRLCSATRKTRWPELQHMRNTWSPQTLQHHRRFHRQKLWCHRRCRLIRRTHLWSCPLRHILQQALPSRPQHGQNPSQATTIHLPRRKLRQHRQLGHQNPDCVRQQILPWPNEPPRGVHLWPGLAQW